MFTLGPPAADDTLREAIAWGLERDVDIDGVHVTDPAFAGSDTLADREGAGRGAHADEGPFDLVLAGRNSVDADTGQVGPELAELLDLPFLTGVRYLAHRRRPRRRALRARRRLAAGRGASCPRCCRARSGCASRPRSTRAGRAAVPADAFAALTAADLGAALATNVVGPFRLTKALLGALAASAREGGAPLVVEHLERAAETPYPGWGAYGASKAALRHLTPHLGRGAVALGIDAVAVDPGDMDTPLHALAVPDADRARSSGRRTPRCEIGEPDRGASALAGEARARQRGGRRSTP